MKSMQTMAGERQKIERNLLEELKVMHGFSYVLSKIYIIMKS